MKRAVGGDRSHLTGFPLVMYVGLGCWDMVNDHALRVVVNIGLSRSRGTVGGAVLPFLSSSAATSQSFRVILECLQVIWQIHTASVKDQLQQFLPLRHNRGSCKA